MSRYGPLRFLDPDTFGLEQRRPGQIDAGRVTPVRIGDAERDEAVSALGEHFVAGRLTREEFDERSDQATAARYAGDLAPLFADLPGPVRQGPAPDPARRGHPWPPGVRPGPPPFVWLLPLAMVGMVLTAILLTAPWILWIGFWFVLFGGPWNRRWHRHGGHRPPGSTARGRR